MNKAAIKALWVILAIILMAGCANPGAGTLAPAAAAQPSQAGQAVGVTTASPAEGSESTEYTGEAEFAESGAFPGAEIPRPFNGSVSFETADASAAELLVDPYSTDEQSLTLEDPGGVVWTLTIPPNAVSKPVTVRMTSLSQISSSDLGSLAYGVLLEPDGLQFDVPAILTLQGESLGSTPILFNGSHDGSRLEFAHLEVKQGEVTAAVTHFSTAYGDPLSDGGKRQKTSTAAGESYQKVRAAALELLKEKVYAPRPPAIPLRCAADAETEKKRDYLLKIFQEEFSMPEEAMIRMVLSSGRNDVIYNQHENDSLELARLLAERLMKKGDLLYKAYYPQEEYFVPVTSAALTAERSFSLMGGAIGDENFITRAGAWARKIADQYLKALRKDHDYQLITTLISMDRQASMLGVSRENSLEEILKALQFEIQYDVQMDVDVEQDSVQSITTEGKVPFNQWLTGGKIIFEKGEGKYTGFSSPFPEASLVLPLNYPIQAAVDHFDACRAFSFDLLVDMFGAEKEHYIYTIEGQTIEQSEGFVMAAVSTAFEENIDEGLVSADGGTFFRFTLPLQNLNPTAGEVELTGTAEGTTSRLRLRLVHTPR